MLAYAPLLSFSSLFSFQYHSDSSLHHIFESPNFRFLFRKKSSLTWAVKCEKLKDFKLKEIKLKENRRKFIRLI